MLPVKEVCCVARIKLHRCEAVMPLQYGTGPFPNTAQVRPAAELTALFGHRDRMPVFETHIRLFQVDEKIVRVETSTFTRVAV